MMMGLSAVANPRYDVPFEALRELGRETTDAAVVDLLGNANWRPQVMGAWLAAGRTKRVGPALLESLEASRGSLTVPSLATVALYGLGAAAVPSLQVYLRFDLEGRWGAASFVAAVLERLQAAPDDVDIEDRDRIYLDEMLAVAQCLDYRLQRSAQVSGSAMSHSRRKLRDVLDAFNAGH